MLPFSVFFSVHISGEGRSKDPSVHRSICLMVNQSVRPSFLQSNSLSGHHFNNDYNKNDDNDDDNDNDDNNNNDIIISSSVRFKAC